jgi:dTDP-4-dehydrorhamnose 3,5-epimerase
MDELLLLKPQRYYDLRGFFEETYNFNEFFKKGLEYKFVQDNRSVSIRSGTLRGLHFQAPPMAQGKLVRCGHGAIFDVAVDIRKGSPSYGNWRGFELSAENGHQLFIPAGFAHGFLTLQPKSEIAYKCTHYFAPDLEGSLLWSSCGIQWPLDGEPVLGEKDLVAQAFEDFESPFVYGRNC